MSKKIGGKPASKPAAKAQAAGVRKAPVAASVKPVAAAKTGKKADVPKPKQVPGKAEGVKAPAAKSSTGKPHIAKPAAKSPAPAAKGTGAKAAAAQPKLLERAQQADAKATPARTMAVAKFDPAKKTLGGAKKMAARAKVSDIVLPPGYRPAENEPFMNEMHRAYFRKRLLDWKDEILRQTRETLAILHEDSTQHADLADRATSETDRATELRTRDRQRKLIAKIDAALARIEDGSYGYCEETGEPIGLKRLDARPIATLSVEAQERHERRERVYREE